MRVMTKCDWVAIEHYTYAYAPVHISLLYVINM